MKKYNCSQFGRKEHVDIILFIVYMKYYTDVIIFEGVVGILSNIYANKCINYDIVIQVIYFSTGYFSMIGLKHYLTEMPQRVTDWGGTTILTNFIDSFND